MSKFEKGTPLPKSLGACVDRYREVRELRLAMQKEVDAVAAHERELKDHLINTISASEDTTGVAGKKFRAQIVTKVSPKADDWKVFYEYVKETGRFDLMQKRLSDKAIKDMWEEGETVPGIGEFKSKDVSVTKI